MKNLFFVCSFFIANLTLANTQVPTKPLSKYIEEETPKESSVCETLSENVKESLRETQMFTEEFIEKVGNAVLISCSIHLN